MTEMAAIPVSPNFDKLKAKLRELFELDKADLDFGIYRILRQRHAEITEFLDKHLKQTVRDALSQHGTVQYGQLEKDLREAETAARNLGIEPEQSPKVKELREKLASGSNVDTTADEIYSHLFTFFSRYYQEGDFLGLHRSTVHGREKYMIPYNGEEVKLVWANMDQYYIKSSELLRDYTFHISASAGSLFEGEETQRVTVHFKLVEGDTEKDNRKPDGKTVRAFALDSDQPFQEADQTTLIIRFRYREHPGERDLQKKLNEATETKLHEILPPTWKGALFAGDPTWKGKDSRDTRTILQKHLRDYTARHQFDYFIHKDLGGFLRRELDFYIKNEVMHLDDIESSSAPKAEEYLSKIRALRRCALPVIRMLEQLENFQKKLWLKKKFVVETRYCLTLDRVPENLYSEICANDAQREEWVRLFAIDQLTPESSTLYPSPAYSVPLTVEFLKANLFLVLDTGFFPQSFTHKLLASIENLDESLDGVCFHSENFQALQLMQERYREQVKCVYIDPPYNTGNDDFCYKDSYQHSSWIALLNDRVGASTNLLSKNGSFSISLDFVESPTLVHLVTLAYKLTRLGEFVWRTRNTDNRVVTKFSVDHEYIHIFSCEGSPLNGRKIDRSNFRNPDNDLRGDYTTDPLTGKANRVARPNLHYTIVNPDTGDVYEPDPDFGWITNKEGFQALLVDNRIYWPEKPQTGKPRKKRFKFEAEERTPVSSLAISIKQGEGNTDLANVIGFKALDFPKPVSVLHSLFDFCGNEASLFLDYFAGSGTTGHAIVNLNREDNGNRKYILVEMGAHFDTVLVPRLKKVIYSTDWKDGNPQSQDTGISHAFKILRLESYEDTLNNLRLHRTPEQQKALEKADDAQRGEYLMGYFLDVESEGSVSLLDMAQFRNPFDYRLQIATSSAGETKETQVDLVETFHWLIGLKVKHIDTTRGFLTVTGEFRAGGRAFIIWRTLSEDLEADNKALEKFLEKSDINPADTEFEAIYLNGPHTLSDPHNKIHLIEETFHRQMFESERFESLS